MPFDLADPKLLFRDDVLADPRPLYDFLRRNAPVWRIPGQDSYVVSDPALIRDAVARTANAIELLARRPDLQADLRANPEHIPDALDDLLRDDGPFQFHYRWSTTDTALGGVSVPASSRLLLMWAAANRPAPDGHGDAGDSSGVHYAFGRGLHFCVGAPLARLESRIAIETLLARTASFTLDDARPPMRRPSIMLRRHASLHVVVARA